MKSNPCKKDCPERSATCHATCEKYSEFSEENRKEKEKIKKENYIKNSLDSYEFENYRKRI